MGLRRCECLHHCCCSAGRGAAGRECGSLQHGAKTASGRDCFVRGDAFQLTAAAVRGDAFQLTAAAGRGDAFQLAAAAAAATAGLARQQQTCHALVQDGSCSGTLDAVVYCTGAACFPPLFASLAFDLMAIAPVRTQVRFAVSAGSKAL